MLTMQEQITDHTANKSKPLISSRLPQSC